ncbi:hypothetical protein DAI22_08g169900 [Oryza sativa Japonica Group]|nr:hypothetical protein DAI22_08g169900 [Oryza sativa Japonica Group]KAF2919903.1 hypothetical protein DAI22_08g169900 [Oryza sativa Japonica Group]
MLLQPEPCLRWIVQIVEPHKQQAQLLTHGWAPGIWIVLDWMNIN